MKTMLTIFVDGEQDKWDENLHMAAFAYNSATHSATNYSQFELLFNRWSKIPLDLVVRIPKIDLLLNENDFASKIMEKMHKAYESVSKANRKRIERLKAKHQRKIRAAVYEVDDKVWCLNEKRKKGQSQAFRKKWIGP